MRLVLVREGNGVQPASSTATASTACDTPIARLGRRCRKHMHMQLLHLPFSPHHLQVCCSFA